MATTITKQAQGATVLLDTFPKQWFHTIVHEHEIDLDVDDVKKWLDSEFGIDVVQYNLLVKILPHMLVDHMRSWPGWKLSGRYARGQLKWDQYYMGFENYLNRYVALAKKRWVAECRKDKTVCIHHHSFGEQSIELDEAEFAPYQLAITCPPAMLNTIFFTSAEDDVIMKTHSELKWTDVNTDQLLNWPFMEVTFISPELSFVRRQANECNRYLNYKPPKITACKSSHIELATIQDRSKPRASFTARLIEAYMTDYVSAIKTIGDGMLGFQLDAERIAEIETIFKHFIMDVKDLGVNDTIATNTLVLFKLGNRQYIRNKKLSALDDDRELKVGFCEYIIPKIELLLKVFDASQDETSTNAITFKCVNEFRQLIKTKEPIVMELLPQIKYRCTFCDTSVYNQHAMLHHLSQNHKMEQAIRCVTCKLQFSVMNLTNNRWSHQCID